MMHGTTNIIFQQDIALIIRITVCYTVGPWAGLAQSVERLATGWTVRGWNPGGGEIFRICLDRSWGPPNLLYNGYRVFPRDKERPGRDADPSPPSSAVVVKG